MIEGSRRQRSEDRGIVEPVAALVVDCEFLEGRAEGQRGVPVELGTRSHRDRVGLEVREAIRQLWSDVGLESQGQMFERRVTFQRRERVGDARIVNRQRERRQRCRGDDLADGRQKSMVLVECHKRS